MTSPGWLTRSLADVPTDTAGSVRRRSRSWRGSDSRSVVPTGASGASRRRPRWRSGWACRRAGGGRSGSRRRPRGLARRPPRPGLAVTQPSGPGAGSLWWAKRTLRSAAISSWSNRSVGRSSTTGWRRPSAGWWRAEPGWVMAVVGEPAPAGRELSATKRREAGPGEVTSAARHQRRGGRVVEQALKLVAFEFRAGFRVEPQAPGHELGVGDDVVAQHRPQRPAILRHQRP
jgi:hypothetical protein